MPANIRETIISLGYVSQADLSTANILADFRTLPKNNAALAEIRGNVETDAEDIGKGHEFAANAFQLGRDTTFQIQSFLNSEIVAFAFAYGLGGSVASNPGSGDAYRHTASPLNPVSGGIELPAFSVIETIRQGASAVLDRMLVGNAVEGWQIALNSGPGRQNAQITIDCVGSGYLTEPSSITVPSVETTHSLNAGSAAITINGTDYVTAKTFVSAEFGFRNNHRLDAGYYPGSGTQDGFQIRGRMEFGDREPSLRFVARFENGSDELTKLTELTEGTAVITLTGALIDGAVYHDLSVTFHRCIFTSAVIGDTDGIVTVAVEAAPMYHESNGLMTCYATNLEPLVADES